jgi:hypothetical protein
MPPRGSGNFGVQGRTASNVLARRLFGGNIFSLHDTRVPAAVLIKERKNISHLAFLKIQFSTIFCTKDNDKLIMFFFNVGRLHPVA